MLKYLKEAFFVRPRVNGLGNIPLNILFCFGFFILGIGHPAFWLLGIGLETAFLFGLAGNVRFQKWVDGNQLTIIHQETSAKREALLKLLTPEARQDLSVLENKINKILDIYRSARVEPVVFDTNKQALEMNAYLYLKILVSKHYLLNLDAKETETIIERKVDELKKDLNDENLVGSLRTSKEATLKIFQKRLENSHRRERSLEEIHSDLTHIQAEVDLALENATLDQKPNALPLHMDLSSQLFDGSLFSDAGSLVSDFDRSIAPSAKKQKEKT